MKIQQFSPFFDNMVINLRGMMETKWFEFTVIALIIVNSIGIGLSASGIELGEFESFVSGLDTAILWFFVAEVLLRMMVFGWKFWRDPWGWFDVLVIFGSFYFYNSESSVLRTFRVLRVMRLLRFIPSLRRITHGLVGAIPGVASVVALLLIVFYVFAVLANGLYGQTFPQWFGTLGKAAFTLFQIMTLESWAMGIVRPVMEIHSYAWMLFISFITITSFTVLNLVIGVLISAMQDAEKEEQEREKEENKRFIQSELAKEHDKLADLIKNLQAQVSELKDGINKK